jgi:hypothetical protein
MQRFFFKIVFKHIVPLQIILELVMKRSLWISSSRFPRRISLLHLAICRGSSAMLSLLRPAMLAAHQRPAALSTQRPQIEALPWQDVTGTLSKCCKKQDPGLGGE